MKIVHLLTYLDSQTGGMERQALHIGQQLQEKGHIIFFITCAHVNRMWSEGWRCIDRTTTGCRVYRIPMIPKVRHINLFLYTIGSMLLLFFLQRRYDIIHAHQLYTSGAVACIAKRFLKSKKLLIKNCCSGEYGDVKFLCQLPFARYVIPLMKKVVDCFVAISPETQAEMQQIGFTPIVFIPNGVDTVRFHPPDVSRIQLKQSLLPEHANKKWILFVGKFDSQKNIPVLFEVAAFLPSEYLIIIVGEGKLRLVFEEAIRNKHLQDKVILYGTTPQIKRMYQSADVFVLPSRAEGLPNALLEALSSGLPCVGSDIAGIRAVITPGVNGYLVPVGDAHSFVSTIIQVISDPGQAKEIGEGARTMVKERFSIDSVVQSYVTLYQSLLHKNMRT